MVSIRFVPFVVPPKSNKGTKKSHPYKGGERRSTRKSVPPASEEQVSQVQETQVRESQPDQIPTTSANSNVSNQPSEQQHESSRPSTSAASPPMEVQVPMPSAVAMAMQPQVSRQEFIELRDNLASIKNSMSAFFSSFSPTNSNPNAQGGNMPQVSGSHIPVLVSNTEAPNASSSQSTSSSTVDQVVQRAVNQHVQVLTQGVNIGKDPSDKPSNQVDRKVSNKMAQDIWENKYVDFLELLDKKQDTYQPLQLVVNESGEQQWVPIKSTKEIATIGQWSRAFDIYLSVYSRKYPEQTHNLLTYSAKVKDLAYNNGDYVRYDREFRISRARYNTPWETPDLELWYQCSQAGLKSQIDKVTNMIKQQDHSFRPSNTSNSSDNSEISPIQSNRPKLKHPTGACFTYHNKGRCGRSNCRFSHACYAPGCNKEHPAYSCPILTKDFSSPLPTVRPTEGTTKSKSSNSNKD